MTVIESKKVLRKEILAKRKALSEAYQKNAAATIFHKLKTLISYAEATAVCLYVPIHNEVDIFQYRDRIWADGKSVYLPKVHGDTMDFYAYEERTALVEGAYHILEPDSDVILCPETERCFIVMPGAVFSKNGDRIGYGGGYYDRYLALHKTCYTAAVGYAMQRVDGIETEPTDIKPDIIILDS